MQRIHLLTLKILFSFPLLLFSVSNVQAAPCFRLISQNALHLGWNDPSSKAIKNKAFATMAQAAANQQANVIIPVQELMDKTKVDILPDTTWDFRSTPSYYGKSSYREAYGFLISSSIKGNVSDVVELGTVDPVQTGNFSRPPAGVIVICGTHTQAENYWVLNFHAIFGKSKTPRKAEATAIINVMKAFLGHTYTDSSSKQFKADNIIVAGDWNLDVSDLRNILTSPTFGVDIIVKTSITRAGNWSKSYDHFAYHLGNSSRKITVANDPRAGHASYACNTAGNACVDLRNFRDNVSDHMGVWVDVE